MVLALVIGDLYVPQRAAHIHEAFEKLLLPGRIQMVFVTGNLTTGEMLRYLRTIAPEVHCTHGELDPHYLPELPETLVVEVEDLKIGLVHGHQVIPVGDKETLAAVQRELDTDILISGATHFSKIFEYDGHLFVNPGSATGAFTPYELNVIPSFVVLDIQGRSVIAFTYYYIPEEDDAQDGDVVGKEHLDKDVDTGVRITKRSWTKQ